MGNICRSPTAHGLFRDLVNSEGLHDDVEIDSAGTHAYHVGEPPDRRASAHAGERGVDLTDLRARQVEAEDFDYFDYILAMDQDNLMHLQAMCPPSQRSKVCLFLSFSGSKEKYVPDPYYGGPSGFEDVLDLVDEGAKALLNEIKNRL